MNEVFLVRSRQSRSHLIVKYCNAERQATLKYQGASFQREAEAMIIAYSNGIRAPKYFFGSYSKKSCEPDALNVAGCET